MEDKAKTTNLKDQIDELVKSEVQKALSREEKNSITEETFDNIAATVREEVEREVRHRLSEILVERKRKDTEKEEATKEEEYQIQRFDLLFRIQHITLFTCVLLLIFTGLPLKFHNSTWARIYFGIIGIETSSLLHRLGACGLMVVSAIHLYYIIFTKEGRYNFWQLLPRLRDITDVVRAIKYFFGFAKEQPRFGRFSYVEKFDYWAVYWGMVIMLGSGFLMWFETASMQFLPKYLIDAAREAHSDEALLATLALIIWHFYNVHFNPSCFPINWTFWTGKISLEKMIEEHPAELDKLIEEGRIDEDGLRIIAKIKEKMAENNG